MMQSSPTDWILDIGSSLSNITQKSLFGIRFFTFVSLVVMGAGNSVFGERIKEITVSKNVSSPEAKYILQATGLQIGGEINTSVLDSGIRNLIAAGKLNSLFIRQNITSRGLELFVDASLKRKIQAVDVSSISPNILDEIQPALAELAPGKMMDNRALANLKLAVRNAYEARGYFFVSVESDVERVVESDSVDIKIRIKEGTPTRINRIKISNVDKETAMEFRRAVHLQVGSPFTRTALEDSINSLNQYLKENQYSDSKVDETNLNFNEDKTKVEVDFVLKIGRKFQLTFVGNTIYTDDVIRSWITNEVLAQSDPIRYIEQLIRGKYQEVGFHFCRVTVVSLKSKDEKVKNVRFQIEEGSKVIIDSVSVVGVADYGEKNFEKLFYQNADGILSRGVFWEGGLPSTCQNMIRSLEEQGYLRVSLPVPRISFSEDNKGAELFFNVELGNQVVVSRVDILGVSESRRKELEPLIEVKVGDPISKNSIARTKTEIEKFYYREGYSDVKIAGTDDIIFGEDPTRAIVRIAIDEGRQYFVGDVSIDGNRYTQAKVIAREVRVKPGEKYNIEKIRQSEDELLLTGLFTRVELIGTSDSNDPSKKNIRVAVVENKAGSGELGLGGVYEDPRFRLRGFVGLAYNNTFGLNQTASIRTEIGLPLTQKFERLPFIEYSAIIGYRAPYLFDIPAVFFSQASLDRYEVGTNAGGKISNLQTRARIEERIEKKLSSTVKFIYRLHRFERATTKTLLLYSADDPENPANPSGNNYQPGFPPATEVVDIGSTGPGLQIDLRDDSFNPTSGSYHTLDGELAHPSLLASNQVRFYMLMLRNSFYLPLFDPFGLAIFAGGGYADSLDHHYSIPKARLLTDLSLGGQGSIRGFSPRIFNPQPDSVTAGFYNLRAELRSQILGDLSGAVFIDSGQIFSKVASKNWNIGLRHDGVGFGLRYKTPVGPAVIDISQGLGPDKEIMKFNFTIGVF